MTMMRSRTDTKGQRVTSKLFLKKRGQDPQNVGLARLTSAIEGWILFVSGVHLEAEEDNVYDLFAEYGPIKNVKVPLNRLTGFLKGYALVEYEDFEHAKRAIEGLNGHKLFDKTLTIDWAFKKGPEVTGRK